MHFSTLWSHCRRQFISTDPRLVKAAIPVDEVTYEEASELSYFGASVLHPIAMQPAMRSDVPVRIKNSYNPSARGTIISNKKTGTSENRLVCTWCKIWSCVLKLCPQTYMEMLTCFALNRLLRLPSRETSKYLISIQQRCLEPMVSWLKFSGILRSISCQWIC